MVTFSASFAWETGEIRAWRRRKRRSCAASAAMKAPRWYGRCPQCGSWNCHERGGNCRSRAGGAPAQPARGRTARRRPIPSAIFPRKRRSRLSSGIGELDRVLGGGAVEGAVMLVGGDPGHRQVHAAHAGFGQHGARGRPGAVRFGRGVRAADQAARAAAGRGGRAGFTCWRKTTWRPCCAPRNSWARACWSSIPSRPCSCPASPARRAA